MAIRISGRYLSHLVLSWAVPSGVSYTHSGILVLQMSLNPRGHMLSSEAGSGVFGRHMFLTMWGPAVHAVSVVLEYVESPAVADMALRVGGACSLLAWPCASSPGKHTTQLRQDLDTAIIALDQDGYHGCDPEALSMH